MQKIKILSVLCCVLWSFSSFAQVGEQIEKAIVRVRSGNKYSTGFFWKDGTKVITTLHSISNSNKIEICLPKTTNWMPASLKKVHKLSDLALLEVAGYISPNFLSAHYTSKPPFNTKSFTVGYNSGSPYYISREFSVGISEKNTLKAILPNTLWTEVKNWGFLDLATEVVYIEGQLLHGFSGSPVVDYQGKLIGIADGGLENGAAGISWCVNANYLPSLEKSTDELAALNQKTINTLFAAEEYENKVAENDYVELNGLQFRKVKTRTFAQLDHTGKYSDEDALGLVQLLNVFSGYDYSSFEYDVYLEETSGATIVLPANDKLGIENGHVVSGSEKIKLYVSVVETMDIQQASLEFEWAVMPYYNTNWLSDEVWSYPYPYYGPNNSIVRKRAYYGNNYRNYLFEALAGKGQYFLGVAVKRDDWSMGPDDYEDWAKYAIAVQLTTFTN